MSFLLGTILLLGHAQAAPQYGAPAAAADAALGVHRAPATLPAAIACHVEYTDIWDTQYTETEERVCKTIYINSCQTYSQQRCVPVSRQECTTVPEKQCSTEYRSVCRQEYRDEPETYTETVCRTEFREVCQHQWEGEGAAKVWVPIAGTCRQDPVDRCEEVARQRSRRVATPVCESVPEERCVTVPRHNCRAVTEQSCSHQPVQRCDQVPKQECSVVHKKVPQRVSRRVPKKVCNGAAGNNNISSSSNGVGVNNPFEVDLIEVRTNNGLEAASAADNTEDNSDRIIFEDE